MPPHPRDAALPVNRKHHLKESVWTRIARLRHDDRSLLAPAFDAGLERGLARLVGKTVRLGGVDLRLDDVVIFETLRTDELQRIYFEQGTTKAETAEYSWHFYGLAVDTIHRTYAWFDNAAARAAWPDRRVRDMIARRWWAAIAEEWSDFADWGGLWRRPDLPHFQWHRCSPTPKQAPRLYREAGGYRDPLLGRRAVWKAVGALDLAA